MAAGNRRLVVFPSLLWQEKSKHRLIQEAKETHVASSSGNDFPLVTGLIVVGLVMAPIAGWVPLVVIVGGGLMGLHFARKVLR